MKDLFEERYRATPAALDRESIIEHLLAVAEEDNMHDCVFNKCEAMIKQYKISANPDWDLPDILDTFTTKQLQELLQYVMDNYKNESLNEDVDDGWDKPFDWTERYVKDEFVIFNNYQGAWHLEQTRPKTKHIGSYKSLEAAKAAGDAEINKRNAKNKDKPVQFGVHSFTSDSIVFRGTEDECAEYINKNGLENDAEIYMIRPDDRHYREVSENLVEDYPRGDAENFVQHPMNYNITGELDFAVADDVKVYLHRGPGKQREFYIVIGDKYVQHSFSKLETVKKYLEKQKLLKESLAKGFNNGDVVYVTVCNRQGRVRKMISPDVVEVELHDNGVYPERIDRYYVDEVELQYSDDLDDEF